MESLLRAKRLNILLNIESKKTAAIDRLASYRLHLREKRLNILLNVESKQTDACSMKEHIDVFVHEELRDIAYWLEAYDGDELDNVNTVALLTWEIHQAFKNVLEYKEKIPKLFHFNGPSFNWLSDLTSAMATMTDMERTRTKTRMQNSSMPMSAAVVYLGDLSCQMYRSDGYLSCRNPPF